MAGADLGDHIGRRSRRIEGSRRTANPGRSHAQIGSMTSIAVSEFEYKNVRVQFTK